MWEIPHLFYELSSFTQKLNIRNLQKFKESSHQTKETIKLSFMKISATTIKLKVWNMKNSPFSWIKSIAINRKIKNFTKMKGSLNKYKETTHKSFIEIAVHVIEL